MWNSFRPMERSSGDPFNSLRTSDRMFVSIHKHELSIVYDAYISKWSGCKHIRLRDREWDGLKKINKVLLIRFYNETILRDFTLRRYRIVNVYVLASFCFINFLKNCKIFDTYLISYGRNLVFYHNNGYSFIFTKL